MRNSQSAVEVCLLTLCKRQRSREGRDVQSRQVHEDLRLRKPSHKTSHGVAHSSIPVPRCYLLPSLPSE